MGETISGRIKMKISRIYNSSCLSLICEAKEVFIKDIINKEIPYYDVLGREINYLWWLINSKEDSTESEEYFSNSTESEEEYSTYYFESGKYSSDSEEDDLKK